MFGLGLLAAFAVNNSLPQAWQERSWILAVLLAGIYLALGAMPLPWMRRVAFVGVAAFLVPLVAIGLISWRIEYFLLFEHVGAWENLPRVILELENLAFATFVSLAAIAGQRLGAVRRITVSAV